MLTWPPHLYRQDGIKKEIPSSIIDAALYDASLVQRQFPLPPILSLKHLSQLTHTPYLSLRKIVERKNQYAYRLFQINKRSGGKRLICVPCKNLLKVQKWINRFVLRPIPAHPSSMAFTRGRSIVECASMHCGCKWLIKLDVQQFFESISERQIYNIFNQFGYRKLVAFELARLCTRIPKKTIVADSQGRWINTEKCISKYSHDAYKSIRNGHLPQGSPTSPSLSNIYCVPLDNSLMQFANESKLVYTRYADDIVLSATHPFSRDESRRTLHRVKLELQKLNLNVNSTKTVIVPPGGRKVVLGLLVDGDQPRLQKKFRQEIELHLYHLETKGVDIHSKNRGFSSVFGLKTYLEGKIAYIMNVEPDYGISLRDRLKKIEWPFNN